MTNSATHLFKARMQNLRLWIDVIDEVNRLAAVAVPVGNARHLVRARRISSSALSLGTALSVVPFEGAFLYVCAEYELAVRTLVEDFAASVNHQVRRFEDLPPKLQERNLSNSATIMNELHLDRFAASGLVRLDVVQKLLSCLDAGTPDHGFELLEEAVSYTWRNFRWKEVKDLFIDLGITNLIDSVCTARSLQIALGVNTVDQAKGALPLELDQVMLTRNRIVHKAGTAATPSSADVRKTSLMLSALVASLQKVLTVHYKNL